MANGALVNCLVNWVSREAATSAKLRVHAVESDKRSLRSQTMPIDWSAVNWLYVAIMAAFVFVAAFIGNIVSLGSRISGALLTAILFAAMYVMWNYYPHPQIQLPIVKEYVYPPPTSG
jgi:hypothetical protein